MDIRSTPEFDQWVSELRAKERAQLDDRLDRIREFDHFGDRRYLGNDLSELRWRSGRRVYYAVVKTDDGRTVLLLLGGDKNGQERDIRRAGKILEREAA